jgi:hypothetical protein
MRHPRVIIAGLGLALPIAGSPAGTGRLSRRQSRLLTRPGNPAATLTTTGHKRAT